MRGSGLLLAALVGCGGGDAGPDGPLPWCGFASDRYLPYDAGYSWRYEITDPLTGNVHIKYQVIDSVVTLDDGLPAFLQISDTPKGDRHNYHRHVGDALVRLEQLDFTPPPDERLERTTDYEPHALRLDEAPDRLIEGAFYQYEFTEIEYDELGVLQRMNPTMEEWEVLSATEPCDAPIGSFPECLHLRRLRVGTQTQQKEFWFARGIGKIREQGGKIEQLASCEVVGNSAALRVRE